MSDQIINKVAGSGLLTIDLEEYYHKGERVLFDLKYNLYQELILKEKDFRDFIKHHDWSQYQGKNVAIICSVDAIVPTWAYMLVANKLSLWANHFVFGDFEKLEQSLFQQAISSIDISTYKDAKVVVKGCGDLPVPTYAYVELTRVLTTVVQSLMYGEPCSTVPIFKNLKQ